MPMDNVTLENTQQSISSRDAKSVASVMVNGKWVNLSDTLEQANVKSDVGTVAKQVAAQQEVVSNAVSTADSAVAYANDAIEKSKVNSQAIVAQSEAISEAKSAIDSSTAEIQQAVANAASDAANIRADVAQVQNEVDTAKAANSASVEALKSDVSATKQDLADVHDSLTKAQAAAEDSQKAIDKSIAQINDSVAATNKDLEGVRNDLTKAQSDITANQKSINDNVAQINSDIEQDRKDIASAQQANADTAKQLDAYSKQAQDQGKTIKSIQDKQDGFTATLADVQGNVTQVSDKVDDLSANLKDAQNNVASVKAQADQLSATLTDHAKSITTLTASAKEVSSTLEDADGRLSKVEQTATGTQQTVANQQGQINSIQTDVSGIHETITGQGNQITTINATLNGLDTKYEGVSGDLNNLKSQAQWVTVTDTVDLNNIKTPCHEFLKGAVTNAPNETAWWYLTVEGSEGDRITQTVIADQSNNRYTRRLADSWSAWVRDATQTDVTALSGQVTTNTTQITQNKQAIALKADQSTVDKLSGEVSQNTAQLKVQADQISSKVSSSDFKTLNDKVNGAISSIQKNSTAIDQTNKQISLKADQTEVDQVKQTATQNSSRLDVMDGKISSKVTSKDVNNIVDSKGFATTNTVQSLITQKADDWNVNLTKLKNDTQTSLTNLAIGVEGVQAQVYNSDGSSKITQLSNVVQSKVSQGDYNSQINQLKNDINLRVQKGDVISQINQEAGGNTLIQVSNGNGSLILDAANTIVKGKEWIPVAAIADLTADQVQAGTLKGVKVDFRDSTGTGMIADGSTLTFDVSNTPAGYLSYNGMPVAELPDGSGGNELAIRYGLSTAIIPDDNSGAQATFSKAAQKIAYMTGTSRGKKMLSGLEVHSNNHHWLGAVNSDATYNRLEVNDRDGLNIAWHDNTHFFISDGNAKLYQDNNDSQTATKLEIHGWAWINGWVEAAGHSQHSALSTKTDIQSVDDDKMLKMVNDTDLTTFLYKTDVANGETHRHIGPIIDDVHDVAQYQTPQDFIAPNGVSRDDDNMIGALFGAVKALTKRIKTLESKVG